MSRDTWINIGCTVFTFGYIALVLLIGIYAYRHDHRQAQQEPREYVEFSEEEMANLYALKRRVEQEEISR